MGFADRSDSFDLNVSLQDHFKWVQKESQIEREKTEPAQKLDLGFKDGQTIKINMKITVSWREIWRGEMLNVWCSGSFIIGESLSWNSDVWNIRTSEQLIVFR